MDSYDTNRSLFDITDSEFKTIHIIHVNSDKLPQQIEKFDSMKKDEKSCIFHHTVDEILYEHYYNCIKDIQIQTPLTAIAISSRKESLVEISSRLRKDFNISMGTPLPTAVLFVDKYEMKKKVLAENIVTALMSEAVLEKGKDLIEKTGFPVVLKPIKDTGSKGVQIIQNNKDLELQLNEILSKSDQYILEQYIDGELYRVDGCVENRNLQFFAVFYENPTCYEYFVNRKPMSERLLKNPVTRNEIQQLINAIITAFNFSNGVFHLELLKNKSDGKFYFLEIAARPGGGAARKLMANYCVDFNVQMIRLDCALKVEPLSLPEDLHLGSVSIPTPNRNKNFVFDKVILPDQQHYTTLYEIDSPCSGQVMNEYDAVSAYFSSPDEDKVIHEINLCMNNLKVNYRP
ncbi:hypothetical protein HDU92_006436 [Lobulomyces angularis]|nr:hypothetical protein HDU92_006436 [Lobulomyces angularis]